MDVATTTVGLTDLKFRLVREDFADAVAWVARNLPTRPTIPVLAGVLLTGSDEGLTISGFDYEVSAEVRVAAEIASPGSVLVSGRLLWTDRGDGGVFGATVHSGVHSRGL